MSVKAPWHVDCVTATKAFFAMNQEQMNGEETAHAEEAAEGSRTEEHQGEATRNEGEADGNGGEEATSGAEDEWKDKYLRLYAEFDNFRKRTMRERGELVRSAGRDLTEALLPVLDDFERAAAAGEGRDGGELSEGHQLIGQKLKGILEARGLQRMEAKGAEFDTDLHEAITQIPAPTPDLKGKVVDVVEPGYKLHDTVLRFAKVVVGN